MASLISCRSTAARGGLARLATRMPMPKMRHAPCAISRATVAGKVESCTARASSFGTKVYARGFVSMAMDPFPASAKATKKKAVQWSDGPIVIGAFEEECINVNGDIVSRELAELDAYYGGALSALCKDNDFKGKPNSICSGRLYFDSCASPMIYLLGLGKISQSFDNNHSWSDFGRRIAHAIPAGKHDAVGVLVPSSSSLDMRRPFHVQALFGSLIAHSVRDIRFKSERVDRNVETVYNAIGLCDPQEELAVVHANGLASGIATTMNLVNAPGNYATPTAFAQLAKDVAESNPDKFSVNVLDRDACESYGEHGMGLFLGVAQGSAEAPKLIHLVYNGNGVGEPCSEQVALIGKGVTFDSGGINIKAGEGSMIELMKFDCGGAASVLGAAVALSKICPRGIQVHFVVPACENMVDAAAIRPGDVLTASNGITVEVNNTDAEGRLTLADALIYTQNETGCKDIVTVATLTGACIVALGENIAGLLANDDVSAKCIQIAAQKAGEPIWRLPLAKQYRVGLDSIIADLKNTGPRPAGTITSALFLEEFVQHDTKWAHLDIAGPVWDSKTGATGFSVATLVEKCRMHESS